MEHIFVHHGSLGKNHLLMEVRVPVDHAPFPKITCWHRR